MAQKRGDYAGRDRPFEDERDRLRVLAAGLNPTTQRWLGERGIGPGWNILEIGAAEGSMARWLAGQVGAGGRVVAADIDVRFMADLELPNVQVRELDVRSDPIEKDHYDLIYCRTLLLHLPDVAAVLGRLRDALVPGGWLVAQEPDAGCVSAADLDHPDASVFDSVQRRCYDHLRSKGIFDAYFGRRLPRLFAETGLEDVGTEAATSIATGGSAEAETLAKTFHAMTPMLTQSGVASADELARVIALCRDRDFGFVTALQVAAWGRRAD